MKEGRELKKLSGRLVLLSFKRVIKRPLHSDGQARAIQDCFPFLAQGMTVQQNPPWLASLVIRH